MIPVTIIMSSSLAKHLEPEKKMKARVIISYHDSSTDWFIVEVPSRIFIELLRAFLRDIKIENREDLSLEDIVKIEPIE